MIRFINLDNQIEEGEKAFAFYDTVGNEFISLDGYHVFDTFEFFKDVFNTSEYEKSHDIKIERFEKLMPSYFERVIGINGASLITDNAEFEELNSEVIHHISNFLTMLTKDTQGNHFNIKTNDSFIDLFKYTDIVFNKNKDNNNIEVKYLGNEFTFKISQNLNITSVPNAVISFNGRLLNIKQTKY